MKNRFMTKSSDAICDLFIIIIIIIIIYLFIFINYAKAAKQHQNIKGTHIQ